jgi:hypothetical protein
MVGLSRLVVSVVECHCAYDGGSVASIMYGDAPGLTADLTVLDVVLRVSAARVETDDIDLAAIRARDGAVGVSGTVAERKVPVEIGLFVSLAVAVVAVVV